MDFSKLKPLLIKLLQFLLLVLGAGGAATVGVKQFAAPAPQTIVAAPTPKGGADYAIIVNFGLKNRRGLPGPTCYSETVVFTLRSDVQDFRYFQMKIVDRKVKTLLNAAFDNICADKVISISAGGAMPYGFYGDLYPIIRWDGSPEAINPELPTK